MDPSRGRTPQTDAEEHALVDALLAGNESAFIKVVRELHGPLQRMAQVWVPSAASAEELVQETWMAVLTGLASFERRARFRSWVFQILINKAKTRAVRDHRSVPFSALVGEDEDPDGPALDPSRFDASGHWTKPPVDWSGAEARLGDKQLVALVQKAIERLPDAQRAVVTLRDVEGMDADEVCRTLGITDTHQRVLLHRARTRLRAELEAHLEAKPC